jgi:23S rRNA 5-hydroxycytidine C2501 synthase
LRRASAQTSHHFSITIGRTMTLPRTALELLAPAKNADVGIEAVRHGADAVYIGGPAFGARAAAGNEVADIERLARYAHQYSAQVFVTLNTILRDDELEAARRLVWQVYEAGADALIVQDMGLLELDLPPLALHASTQTDNRTPEKVKFLEDVGFSQVVLARELDLQKIRSIAVATSTRLEFFVHGALCVSYSGQCTISQAIVGRSANRGECAQFCRLPYDLKDKDGNLLAQKQHLLSLKDNNQTDNLEALADAGISAFKIEGRMKDVAYVKNVTAHYRQRLDAILEGRPAYRRASAGRTVFSFVPQPEKTFNRGFSDYFVRERQGDAVSLASPKFAGAPIGRVSRLGPNWFEIESEGSGDGADRGELHNGDGLSFLDAAGTLVGLRINRVEGRRVFPGEGSVLPRLHCEILRNRDHSFERQLEKDDSAERTIGVRLVLGETEDGFCLVATCEEGVSVRGGQVHAKSIAKQPERALATMREQLGKLGGTQFHLADVAIELAAPWFLPVGALNALRRQAIEALGAARAAAYRRPPRHAAVEPPMPYPESSLSYLGNVYNAKARAFYTKHGVSEIADAFECGKELRPVSLMIAKYCVRYNIGQCPKLVKGVRPEPLTLQTGANEFVLQFDCKRCEMHVVGKAR